MKSIAEKAFKIFSKLFVEIEEEEKVGKVFNVAQDEFDDANVSRGQTVV